MQHLLVFLSHRLGNYFQCLNVFAFVVSKSEFILLIAFVTRLRRICLCLLLYISDVGEYNLYLQHQQKHYQHFHKILQIFLFLLKLTDTRSGLLYITGTISPQFRTPTYKYTITYNSQLDQTLDIIDKIRQQLLLHKYLFVYQTQTQRLNIFDFFNYFVSFGFDWDVHTFDGINFWQLFAFMNSIWNEISITVIHGNIDIHSLHMSTTVIPETQMPQLFEFFANKRQCNTFKARWQNQHDNPIRQNRQQLYCFILGYTFHIFRKVHKLLISRINKTHKLYNFLNLFFNLRMVCIRHIQLYFFGFHWMLCWFCEKIFSGAIYLFLIWLILVLFQCLCEINHKKLKIDLLQQLVNMALRLSIYILLLLAICSQAFKVQDLTLAANQTCLEDCCKTLPNRQPQTYIYYQKSGRFVGGIGQAKIDDLCYSGSGEGTNNPEMQCVPFKGPLPATTYKITWCKNILHQTIIAPCSFFLEPQFPYEMCDRDDFFIHGCKSCTPGDDTNPPFPNCSAGCIIMSYANRRKLRIGDIIIVRHQQPDIIQ